MWLSKLLPVFLMFLLFRLREAAKKVPPTMASTLRGGGGGTLFATSLKPNRLIFWVGLAAYLILRTNNRTARVIDTGRLPNFCSWINQQLKKCSIPVYRRPNRVGSPPCSTSSYSTSALSTSLTQQDNIMVSLLLSVSKVTHVKLTNTG